MGLIGDPIALFDLASCEAFVQRTVDKSEIEYGPAEREELLAEGLTILYELAAKKYKPLPEPPCGYAAWALMSLVDKQAYERRIRPPGTKGVGRFSGYAAMFLPRRLGDAWHRSHPEHRYVTDPETGKRGWSYTAPMLSLDGLTDSTSDEQHQPDRLLLNAKGINAFCHATRAATLRVLGRASPRPAC